MRLFAALSFFFAVLAVPTTAQNAGLRQLDTRNDTRGWEAVGRLNLGENSFCTGALIAPNLVLTAAHCLYDRVTGKLHDTREIEFLAGWRNGRAEAYRGARRAMAHPSYRFDGAEQLDRVAHDLALIELDQPIRLPSIKPFETDRAPGFNEAVGVVSYAKDRAEAPSLEEVCQVLGLQPGVLVMSCNVDFGSSGAPVFAVRDGVARVVSVVSAKGELTGQKVALGTTLGKPLDDLIGLMDRAQVQQMPRQTPSQGQGGAKFLRSAP
jgi:V8-like Glu-specific endopeptidase